MSFAVIPPQHLETGILGFQHAVAPQFADFSGHGTVLYPQKICKSLLVVWDGAAIMILIHCVEYHPGGEGLDYGLPHQCCGKKNSNWYNILDKKLAV